MAALLDEFTSLTVDSQDAVRDSSYTVDMWRFGSDSAH